MGPPSVRAALARSVAGLPGGGEARDGQVAMAEAVGEAIRSGRHLVVQAGTGTGKSLAYLVPAVLASKRIVVATATRALQDQLANRDLPLLEARLGRRFRFAVLKGRSNYICRQRLTEVLGGGEQLGLDDAGTPAGEADGELPWSARQSPDAPRPGGQIRALLAWAETSETGDRAELGFEPSDRAWSAVSVSSRECPGASHCPSGESCFAEAARDRAAEADIVVVNTHLYGAHLASRGAVLPPHDVVVFDEAHELEDVATESLGRAVGAGRLRALARMARHTLGGDGTAIADDLEGAAQRLEDVLGPAVGNRLPRGLGDEIGGVIALASQRVERLSSALRRRAAADGPAAERDETSTRALLAAGHLVDDLSAIAAFGHDEVAWVEGPPRDPTLQMAPIEIGQVLGGLLWSERTAILTSATIPPGIEARLGLPSGGYDRLDAGSPFPYATNALLYCATHLPDRRDPGFESALHEELARLIEGAGGRTLALFTSWRAMSTAAAAVRERVRFRVLTQSDLPKPALIEAFTEDESSCLFATLGFWQGVDVPGRSLTLVTIDRIPFPRPDEPLVQARRERAGAAAFRLVDLPRAAALLAQGAGRLIRSCQDRGVVAVLDPRLGRASYRWDLVRALPPMARTRDPDEVNAFLAAALE